MKLPIMIVGEIALLLASVLVFRSMWMMLDHYFENSHIEIMLAIGISLTIVVLFIINHEMLAKVKKKKSKKKQLIRLVESDFRN